MVDEILNSLQNTEASVKKAVAAVSEALPGLPEAQQPAMALVVAALAEIAAQQSLILTYLERHR